MRIVRSTKTRSIESSSRVYGLVNFYCEHTDGLTSTHCSEVQNTLLVIHAYVYEEKFLLLFNVG